MSEYNPQRKDSQWMEIKEWKREEDDYQGIDTEICFPEDPTHKFQIFACTYLPGTIRFATPEYPLLSLSNEEMVRQTVLDQSESRSSVSLHKQYHRTGFCTSERRILPLESVDDHDASWQKQRQEALTTSYYELRVHVYQASDLPPADDDGSLDPLENKVRRSKELEKTIHSEHSRSRMVRRVRSLYL